jgi:hypothetical protein
MSESRKKDEGGAKIIFGPSAGASPYGQIFSEMLQIWERDQDRPPEIKPHEGIEELYDYSDGAFSLILPAFTLAHIGTSPEALEHGWGLYYPVSKGGHYEFYSVYWIEQLPNGHLYIEGYPFQTQRPVVQKALLDIFGEKAPEIMSKGSLEPLFEKFGDPVKLACEMDRRGVKGVCWADGWSSAEVCWDWRSRMVRRRLDKYAGTRWTDPKDIKARSLAGKLGKQTRSFGDDDAGAMIAEAEKAARDGKKK